MGKGASHWHILGTVLKVLGKTKRPRAWRVGPWLVVPSTLLAIGCRDIFGLSDVPPLLRDAGTGGDGGGGGADPDAGTGGSAGGGGVLAPDAGRFCDQVVPTPYLCSDFDGEDFLDGWENANVNPDPTFTNGGEFLLDAAVARSLPHSVSFRLPALSTSDDNATAFLFRQLPDVSRTTILLFDARIGAMSLTSETGKVVLASVRFGTVGLVWIIQESDGTVLSVVDLPQQKTYAAYFTTAMSINKWRSVRLLIHNKPMDELGDGDVTALIDGDSVRLPVPASFQDVASGPVIGVGPSASMGPMGAFRVNVDNVRIELPAN